RESAERSTRSHRAAAWSGSRRFSPPRASAPISAARAATTSMLHAASFVELIRFSPSRSRSRIYQQPRTRVRGEQLSQRNSSPLENSSPRDHSPHGLASVAVAHRPSHLFPLCSPCSRWLPPSEFLK